MHNDSQGNDGMRGLAAIAGVLFLVACARLPPAEVPHAPRSGAEAVVSDIDGTLTPENLAFNEVRPAAAQTITAYSSKGYEVIYLSTRIPGFQADLPAWLRRNGFPDGTIHVAQTREERDNPAHYKSGMLARYAQQGWHLAYAYGDSSTDFQAYAQAGIPREHVFALKRRGQDKCENGVYKQCLDGWGQNLQFVDQQVPVAR
jgi:phosphatidate phosphatase PAH1